MAIFLGDQNQAVLISESGLYGSTSGTAQWLGLVTDAHIKEDMGVFEIRYQGQGNRDVGMYIDGPNKANGTLTYFPQDFRFLSYALGSCVDAGSPIYTHTLSAINSASGNAYTSGTRNPFMSFALEVSKKAPGTGTNYVRTAKGCVVDGFKLKASQGKELTVDLNFIAQSVANSSGAQSTVTALTARPFLWKDVTFDLPSGTHILNLTDIEFDINNKFDAKFFLNGSNVIDAPQATNRDYNLVLTMEASSEWSKVFYEQYYKGGSTFNALWSISASVGSRTAFLTFSGCRLVDMDDPTPAEGVNTQKVTISPQTCSVAVTDLVPKYNPW